MSARETVDYNGAKRYTRFEMPKGQRDQGDEGRS